MSDTNLQDIVTFRGDVDRPGQRADTRNLKHAELHRAKGRSACRSVCFYALYFPPLAIPMHVDCMWCEDVGKAMRCFCVDWNDPYWCESVRQSN